jgi:hypothetical protein
MCFLAASDALQKILKKKVVLQIPAKIRNVEKYVTV